MICPSGVCNNLILENEALETVLIAVRIHSKLTPKPMYREKTIRQLLRLDRRRYPPPPTSIEPSNAIIQSEWLRFTAVLLAGIAHSSWVAFSSLLATVNSCIYDFFMWYMRALSCYLVPPFPFVAPPTTASVWYGMVRYGMVWYGMVRVVYRMGSVRHASVRYG